MARSIFHGKRGSNAGDAFHDLWALRRALETISSRSSVQYITVEGIAAEKGVDPDAPQWDGVDCAIYHGADRDRIDRIEIVQAKYSPSAPASEWTLARFVYSAPGKHRNGSVAARLAEAFEAMVRDHPEIGAKRSIAVKLVSNQPASKDLLALKNRSPAQAHLSAVSKATGLKNDALSAFLDALDFSECGTIGRHGLEEKFIKDIAAWDDVDTAQQLLKFLEFIRSRMGPEGHRHIIDAESILSIFRSGNIRAIFPCPPAFELVEGFIPRAVAEEIVQSWAAGEQCICLHGQGGEGKTTVLADVAGRLPENSLVVAFDCYGGGSYLNSNAYRHRARDAFVQLSNDCSAALLLPLLLTQNRDADHPRLFMDRLRHAADALAEVAPDALLVVAVDAADNSVAAAEDAADGVPSFVGAFLKLGDPPPNVRFLVSARTGRLAKVGIPTSYKPIKIGPFTPDEAATFLNQSLGEQPSDWHSEVYRLSGGNPRVIKYGLDASGGDPVQYVAYLAPNGKDLSSIFAAILKEAFRKAGAAHDVQQLCAALALLPRPIPVAVLAEVSGHPLAHVDDILSDLRPGVIISDGRVGFRDEDFENFVRDAGGEVSSAMLERAADYFIATARIDAYSAEHASNILVRAERHAALLDLAREDINDYPVLDPAVRTMIHETRMRSALRVSRKSGDAEAGIKLLLAGADAFRRDAAIRNLLFDNIELSSHFSRDQMRQIFLGDPDKRPRHGKYLMHSIAAGGATADPATIAHERRLLIAWFASHGDEMAKRRDGDQDGDNRNWELDEYDLAAYAVGRMEVEDAAAGFRFIRGARPAKFRARILHATFDRLARSGKYRLMAELVALLPRRYPRIGLVQILLALGGQKFDMDRLLGGLEDMAPYIPRLLETTSDLYSPSSKRLDLLEMILGGIEIALLNGAPRARLRPLLKALSPADYLTPSRMNRYANAANNAAIRAAVMVRRLDGRKARAEDIVSVPKIEGRSKEAARERRERDADVQKAVMNIATIATGHAIRCDAILGRIVPRHVVRDIAAFSRAIHKPSYRRDDYFEQRGRQCYLARSFLILAVLRGIKAASLLDIAVGIEGDDFPASESASELLRLAQYVPPLAQLVPNRVEAICASWRHQKLPGDEKIELITRYTSIALYQSPQIANRTFNLAVEIASEIDAESVQALSVCRILARHGRTSLDAKAAKRAAEGLGAIAKDVGERVGSQENFPWNEIMAALALLDLPLALALCARFDETGLERMTALLDPLAIEGLDFGSLSPGAATALLALAGPPASTAIDALVRCDLLQNQNALECLAQDILWRRSGSAESLANKLDADEQAGVWARALKEAGAFSASLPDRERPPSAAGPRRAKAEKYGKFDWTKIGSAQLLAQAIEKAHAKAPKDSYLLRSDLLIRAVDQAPPYRRVDALDYATARPDAFGYTYHIGDFLVSRLEAWSDDAAVARWRENRLTTIIADQLPNIVRYIEHGQSKLGRLLELAEATNEQIVDCLLAGVENGIDELGSGQVYMLAGEIARHAPPESSAAALEEHIGRRLERLAVADRTLQNMTDVPQASDAAIARLIFAALGSTSAPRRWEAAHAARRLARCGEQDILENLVACYDRTSESSFGHPVAPFCILNARLWLLIALARSANEIPAAIAPHRAFLFEVGESQAFPHVLVRAFAKQALESLASFDPEGFTDDERGRIAAINTSPLPRAKRPKKNRYTIFDRSGFYKKGRKFGFDSMDTLPYVYEYAVRGFAAPTEEDFLDRAEHWILNVWKAPEKAYEVDKLRHSDHFREREGLSSSTSHGSLPSVERYQTYLEYHAMYCAVGDLLLTHPLRENPDDNWDRFDTWLGGRGLTMPPIWLSDLRGPKPLEEQFWQGPHDKDKWLAARSPDEVRRELGLDGSEWITLAADHYAFGDDLSATVGIEASFVSPETANALRRAVEAQPSSYGYRLAIRRDDEIDRGAFQLKSFLCDRDTERGIDTHDWFRGELDGPSILPRHWLIERLDLSPATSGVPGWVDSAGRDAIRVTSWSDEAHRGGGPSFNYRVHGVRFAFRRDLMAKLLEELSFDLAVELKMQRSIGERYGSRRDEKEQKTEYDRLIILRRDGSIDASDGHLGRWLPDRTRTGPHRGR